MGRARRNLHEAAKTGQVARFIQLLDEDPYLVDEVSFACSRNILHIATMHGQAGIVEVVTGRNPQLARELDSQKSSPLHIAAAKGYVEIIVILIRVAPEMCWWRDGQGMNPVHIAAMNGNVDVMDELLRLDSFPAMERVHRGQTVLHLCVKHRRRAALVFLVANLKELVNVEDDDGDMVLHLAIRLKEVGLVRYLVDNHKTYELPTNSKGQTVQQISRQLSPDEASREIDEIISQRISRPSDKPDTSFLGTMSDITMVVVVLIAAMAFQAVVSPAGGVWQDDHSSSSSSSSSSRLHKAGEAVMASTRPAIFQNFIRANAVAFTSSLVTIVLLTTGLPARNKFFTLAAMCTMWLSLASIAISYVASAIVINPNMDMQSLTHVIHVLLAIFLIIYVIFCISTLVTSRSKFMAHWMAYKWRHRRPAVTPLPTP